MSLDTVDTVKSTFGSLTTDTGLKVIGLLLAVQLASMAGSFLVEQGAAMAVLGGSAMLAAGIAGVLVTLGAFRSFDSETVSREQYTENVLWPVIRIFGANTTTSLFAFGVALAGLVPVGALLAVTGIGMGTSMGAATGASLLVLLLGVIGLAIGVALFAYIYLTLIVSLPMIAADDRRLFEALDTSIQRTKGNKLSMFLAVIPVAALYITGFGVISLAIWALGPELGGAVGFIGYTLFSAFMGAVFLSLLTEFNGRLPE